MSTLSSEELKKNLLSKDPGTLIITPILDWDAQVGQIGVDVRLSNQFIVFRRQNLSSFDEWQRNSVSTDPQLLQEEVVIPFGNTFVLHAGEMVLGATFEYISMPHNLEGAIEGRFSWARIGLVNATAVTIDPGFKGVITLELANLSNVPISLYPGSRIGQLICRETSSTTAYDTERKYTCPIGPEYSRLSGDPDLEILAHI